MRKIFKHLIISIASLGTMTGGIVTLASCASETNDQSNDQVEIVEKVDGEKIYAPKVSLENSVLSKESKKFSNAIVTLFEKTANLKFDLYYNDEVKGSSKLNNNEILFWYLFNLSKHGIDGTFIDFTKSTISGAEKITENTNGAYINFNFVSLADSNIKRSVGMFVNYQLNNLSVATQSFVNQLRLDIMTYDKSRAVRKEMDVDTGKLPENFVTGADNYINEDFMVGQKTQYKVEGYNDTPDYSILYRTKKIESGELNIAPQTSPEGTKGKKFVILVHALMNTRASEYTNAWQWSMRDYYSVSYDQHGWGDSAKFGLPTLGNYEARDLSRIIRQIVQKYEPSEIVIRGDSMGAGTVSNYAGLYYNGDKAIASKTNFMFIQDSAYGSASSAVSFLVENKLNGILKQYNLTLEALGIQPLSKYGFLNKVLTAFQMDSVKPLERFNNFDAPVMIVHGSLDAEAPYSDGVAFASKKIIQQQPAMFLNIKESRHVRSFIELGHDSTYTTEYAQGNIFYKYVDHFMSKFGDGKYRGVDQIIVPETYNGVTLTKNLLGNEKHYKEATWGMYIGEENTELYTQNMRSVDQIHNWLPNQGNYN